MAWLAVRLGNGKFGITDLDNPDQPPQVTLPGITTSVSDFSRILNEEFQEDEEVLLDKPVDYHNGYEYVAVAPSGSLPTDPVWKCVRKQYDANGRGSRLQYRVGIIWNSRQTGW